MKAFLVQTMTSKSQSIQDSDICALYDDYGQAVDIFNSLVEDNGGEAVPVGKHERPLSVKVNAGYIELWIIERPD